MSRNYWVAVAGCTAIAVALSLYAQQSNPQPPPQGARRDPGFFGGPKGKKGEDENTRAVAGVVRGLTDEVVEGAVVQLKDTKSLRVRSYITKDDGVYRFSGLSTNADYELRARFQGLESDVKTLSIFDSRKQAVVNIKLEPKKSKESEKEEKSEP